MIHDYMAIKGNSSSAEIKTRRKEFLKLATIYTIRVCIVAILIFLTTK
ncbi:hypothetical protein [Pseudoalteromonas phage vB_Pun_Y3]